MKERETPWSVLIQTLSRPSGAIGLILVAFHLVLALLSPYVSPYDFKAISGCPHALLSRRGALAGNGSSGA